jgi:plasmid stability protein
MGTVITIRNLDERVKHLLRVRAATHGRAMEAEARDILTQAVMPAAVQPASPPKSAAKSAKSACGAVRGAWKGRLSTDEILKHTREG